LNEEVESETLWVAGILQSAIKRLQVGGTTEFTKKFLGSNAKGVDDANKGAIACSGMIFFATESVLSGSVISDEVNSVCSKKDK